MINLLELQRVRFLYWALYIPLYIADHHRAVEAFWNRLLEQGYIKEGKHQGYYSVNEESFIAEKDLLKDKDQNFVTEAGERVEFIEEKNYVFEVTPQIKEAVK